VSQEAESNAQQIAEKFFSSSSSDPAQDDAISLISSTVQRAKALFEPYIIDCPTAASTFDPLKSYKIAVITYPVRIRTISDDTFPKGPAGLETIWLQERHFDHFDLCLRDERTHVSLSAWCEKIKQDCNAAVKKEGVRFILINELGYPNFWPGNSDLTNSRMTIQLERLHASLNRYLQKLATKENVIIIAGSYHDWLTFSNITRIYFPSEAQSCQHLKLTSAYKVNEHIKVARGAKYLIYDLGDLGLKFSIFVCTDAFDLNIFFRQILYRKTSDTKFSPQLYFVPSYYVPSKNGQHSLREACMQLSKATGATVVFANQMSDTDGRAVFVAGNPIELRPNGSFSVAEINPAEVIRHQAENNKMRTALTSMISKTKAPI
jgi:hypothetical protein